MNHSTAPLGPEAPIDRFGRQVASRLSEGAPELPHDIAERLRAARVRAVSRRRVEAVVPRRQPMLAPAGLPLGGDEGPGWWGGLASAVPLVMLAAGLVAINVIQDDLRAAELAEVDAALLTDDLPPAAYADPGFAQFLKSDE